MTEYEIALEAHNKAIREFRAAQEAYRSRKIHDAEFLAAKAKYEEATKVFDIAFAKAAT